jgi:hypothetical protein
VPNDDIGRARWQQGSHVTCAPLPLGKSRDDNESTETRREKPAETNQRRRGGEKTVATR